MIAPHATHIIHSARLVSGGTLTSDAWVAFSDDTVLAVGTGTDWRALAAPDALTTDTAATETRVTDAHMTGAAQTDAHVMRALVTNALTTDAAVTDDPTTDAPVTDGPPTDTLVTDAQGTDALVTDAAGRYLTPGFVDIHCHGGGGASFDDGGDHIATAVRMHRVHGTTRSVLSLVTASLPVLERRLADAATAMDRDPLIVGLHLEGPFLNELYRGAHDSSLLQAPDAASIDRLLAASRGRISQVTLAPELPGAAAALRRFGDAHVAVAVGHSAANFDAALSAFAAGASILTHAFNAMPGLHHRAPGPVAAAIASPGVTLEIINDGVHVHPEIVRLAFVSAPGRVALVTDAMAAAGAPDGSYRLGTLDVTVHEGVARLADGGAIAGSTLTLDVALRRTIAESGIPLPEAVRAVTETPARAIGRASDLGTLAPGFAADAVILSDSLHVEAVFAAGIRLL